MRARVWWAMEMRCGMALGGLDTLGSVDTLGSGRRGDCCGVGGSSNTSRVDVASWKRLAREAGAGVRSTYAGNGGGNQWGTLGASCSLTSCMSA